MSKKLILPAGGWKPRPYQQKLWNALEGGCKRAIAVWHRRAGKDEIALNFAATQAMTRPGNYWHCLPLYSAARKAIWQSVNPHTGRRRIDEAFPKEIRKSINETEMHIKFVNGSTWSVIGSDSYDALVGAAPKGIVWSEFGRANPASWSYLLPILVENNGWALIISTPYGRNALHSMLQMARNKSDWYTEVSTVRDTGAISLEAVEDQRLEYQALFGQDVGDSLIEQEYFCSFEAAVLGAYWGKELGQIEAAGQINNKIEIDRSLPIHTSWDLGIDDPCAIWVFQVGNGRINICDFYESSGHGLSHYTDWLADKGYRGGIDWVPHDARARDIGSGRTRVETLLALGRKPRVVPSQSLMDGVNSARLTIPICHFHEGNCAKGLEALRSYKAEWSEELRTFKKSPAHDWASHASDSFRYLSLAWRQPVAAEEVVTTKQIVAAMCKPKTWNEIWAMRAEELRERDDVELPEHFDDFNLNNKPLEME